SEVIPIQRRLARKILARYTCDSQEIRLGGDIYMLQSAANRWVLLIHQIPPKPNYFRVKIGRRLQRLGAVALKNSVYVLPRSDQAQEDFQWVAREIAEGGGDASVCDARFIEGVSDSHIEALFHAARDADYAGIAEEAREFVASLPRRGQLPTEQLSELESRLPRLK